MEQAIHTRIYAVIFFLLAVLGIGFVCYRVLSPFLAAIAWAIVLAVAFQKPWSFLERRVPSLLGRLVDRGSSLADPRGGRDGDRVTSASGGNGTGVAARRHRAEKCGLTNRRQASLGSERTDPSLA